MKALICTQCNNNNLVQQGDIYVCEYCGTQYTNEQIQKMQIEGTVKIDNTDLVQKFLQNARRAKLKEDWEETEKYYNMVEQNDPTNIEAIFYSSYGKAKASLIENDLYKRQAVFKVLQNCVSILDDNFDLADEEENKRIIEQISNDIIAMAESNYVYTEYKNGYGVVTKTNKYETVTLFNSLGIEFCTTLENIAKKIPDSQKQKRIHYYKVAIAQAEYVLKNGSLTNPQPTIDRINNYHRLIHEIDSSYVIPESPVAPKAKVNVAGCVVGFIAVAVIAIVIGYFIGYSLFS